MMSYTGHVSMIGHKAAGMKNSGIADVHFRTRLWLLSRKEYE